MSTNYSKPDFVIVVGASAGGWKALEEFVSYMPEHSNVSVFIILHISGKAISKVLADRLQTHTSFTCAVAEDGLKIQSNHIYVAAANAHMLLKAETITLGCGPTESRWRPSIDVLFRSAAAIWTNRVIGIVMTGMLSDGVAGMDAIKKCGGICIVQDPNEAEFPDMPLAVLDQVSVDFNVSLSEMWAVISSIVVIPPLRNHIPPLEVVAEAEIAERTATSIKNVKELGEKSLFSCPDCGGGLWQVRNSSISRYRCHIGHSYNETELATKQTQSIEATLWVALRMMEERYVLLQKMATSEAGKGYKTVANQYAERMEETKFHINELKKILEITQQSV